MKRILILTSVTLFLVSCSNSNHLQREAIERGAILENEGDYKGALSEYIKADDEESNSETQSLVENVENLILENKKKMIQKFELRLSRVNYDEGYIDIFNDINSSSELTEREKNEIKSDYVELYLQAKKNIRSQEYEENKAQEERAKAVQMNYIKIQSLLDTAFGLKLDSEENFFLMLETFSEASNLSRRTGKIAEDGELLQMFESLAYLISKIIIYANTRELDSMALTILEIQDQLEELDYAVSAFQ